MTKTLERTQAPARRRSTPNKQTSAEGRGFATEGELKMVAEAIKGVAEDIRGVKTQIDEAAKTVTDIRITQAKQQVQAESTDRKVDGLASRLDDIDKKFSATIHDPDRGLAPRVGALEQARSTGRQNLMLLIAFPGALLAVIGIIVAGVKYGPAIAAWLMR